MKIVRPLDKSTVGLGPVSVLIQFSDSGYSNFLATLDKTDVTSRFVIAYDQATATFVLPPGTYALVASADVYDTFYRRVIAYRVSSTFTLPGPSFTLSPDPSLVLRRGGGSAPLTASIIPTGGFVGPVTLSVPNPPQGIVAGTTTLPAGTTTGQVALTATHGSDYGDRTVTLEAKSGGIVATTTFTLRVFHAEGPFTRASFAVTTPPQTMLSSTGVVRVTARLGTDEGLPSAFAAVFERHAGVGRLGQPIPFNHGSTNPNQPFGGAGFCAGSLAGFVISGKGPGVVAPASAQYVASVLEFTNPLAVGEANVTSFRNSGTTPYYFEPAVYFSPDCSLAIAVGAHPTGPEDNEAQVIDLKSSRVVGALEFSAASFAASVDDAGTGQRVELTAGGQSQNVNLH
jgi:hypothetical protein